MEDGAIVARLLADPRLLRLPLVRHGNEVTAGPAEAIWTRWLRPPGAFLTRRHGDDDADDRRRTAPTTAQLEVVGHEAASRG